MFCIQCGSKLVDGSVFCHICGSKVIQPEELEHENVSVESTPLSSTAKTAASNQVVKESNEKNNEPALPTIETESKNQDNVILERNADKVSSPSSQPRKTVIPVQTGKTSVKIDNDSVNLSTKTTTQRSRPIQTDLKPAAHANNTVKRKKSKHSWASTVFAAVLALMAAAMTFVILNWSKEGYYVWIVKQHRPFSEYKNLDYTIGEVIDRYVESPEWKNYIYDDVIHVNVIGGLKSFDGDFSAIFTVEVQNNIAIISLMSISINGDSTSLNNDIRETLYDMFYTYSQNYSSFYIQ